MSNVLNMSRTFRVGRTLRFIVELENLLPINEGVREVEGEG